MHKEFDISGGLLERFDGRCRFVDPHGNSDLLYYFSGKLVCSVNFISESICFVNDFLIDDVINFIALDAKTFFAFLLPPSTATRGSGVGLNL